MTRRVARGERSRTAGARPFTLVVCRAGCDGPAAAEIMDEFRHTVEKCPHGVLVSSGCLRGVLPCHAAGPYGHVSRGVFAVAQPCDTHRRPTGKAIRLGPIGTRAQAAAVCRWLRAGLPDDGSLPARLLAGLPPYTVAHLN